MSKLASELGLNPVAQVRLAGLQLDLFDQPARGTGTDGPSTGFGQYRRQ
jgi:phage terminase small subunit